MLIKIERGDYMNTVKPVDRILTEEEVNKLLSTMHKGGIAEKINEIAKSHRAQSEYIQAQDEAAKDWMKENAELRNELDKAHKGGLIYD